MRAKNEYQHHAVHYLNKAFKAVHQLTLILSAGNKLGRRYFIRGFIRINGGHAVFAIYEIITRRKPSEKLLERAQYVGMLLLIALMILAQANDILRFFGF